MSRNPDFDDQLEKMRCLHDAKNRDYAEESDVYANFRDSELIGIPMWKMIVARLQDKWRRITKYARTEELENESFEDALRDNAIYSILCLLTWREAKRKEEQQTRE